MDSDISLTFLLIFKGVKSPKLGLDFQPHFSLSQSRLEMERVCEI